jgi:hypothetical protein
MRYRQPRCRVPLGVALTVYLNLEFYFDFIIGAGNEMRYRQPRCRVPLGVALTVYLNLEFYFDFIIGAGNEIRTRDPNLGKVVLYH